MEAHRHRLYQSTGLGRKPVGRDYLLPRKNDKLTHSTVALDTQRLVVLTGIHSPIPATGAMSATGIGVARHLHPWLQAFGNTFSTGFYHGSHLVTRNDGILGHSVSSHKGVDVRAAKAHILHFEQHLALLRFGGSLHFNHFTFLIVGNLYCFHSDIFFI